MSVTPPQSAPPPPGRLYRFGSFELNTRTGELHRNGLRIRIQEQPQRLLAALLERAGDLVTREELHQKIWPEDTFVDFEMGLNTAIRKLREALSDSVREPQYIETIPRRGYRFLCDTAVFDIDGTQLAPKLFPATEWINALTEAAAAPTSPSTPAPLTEDVQK